MINRWFIIDSTNKKFGRLVSNVGKLLTRYDFSDSLNCMCSVKLIIINVGGIKMNKRYMCKKYWYHTGYPGGIKFRFACDFPVRKLFLKSLRNMLPNNRIRSKLLNNIFFRGVTDSFPIDNAQYLDI